MAITATQSKNLNIHSVKQGDITWIDIPAPSIAEMKWLEERYPFHSLDLDGCLSRVQLPKLDEYDTYLFLVLHFPIFSKQSRITLRAEVDTFVGADYVVTVHTGVLKPLVKLFHDCQQSDVVRQEVLGRSSGYLLYRILDTLVDYCFPILRKVIQNVDLIEERIFEEREREVVKEISVIRRDIISYRRIVRPQLEVLEEKEYPFLKVDPDVYFGDLADHMRRILVELEDVREVMASLADAFNSFASHHTNEVVRVLTIIATIMLPLSVVSGLYGMNVRLPLASSGYAFAGVLGAMALIATVMLIFFRLRRWI